MKNINLLISALCFAFIASCTQSLTITEGTCTKINTNQNAFIPIKGSNSSMYINNKSITFTVIERVVHHRNKYLVKDNCRCRDAWELLYVSNYNDSIIFSRNNSYTITEAFPSLENCAIKWHDENVFTNSITVEHKDTIGNFGPNLDAIIYSFDTSYAIKELVFFNSFNPNNPGIYKIILKDGTAVSSYNSFGFSSDNSTRVDVVEGCD